MATYIEVDPANRMVFSRIEGVLDSRACKDHMTHLLTSPAFQPTFSQVLDFRSVEKLELTPDEVRMLAQRTVFSPTARRAFLVATDLQFGLVRMFGTHRDIQGEGFVRAFRSVSEAADWVGLPSNLVEAKLGKLRTDITTTPASTP